MENYVRLSVKPATKKLVMEACVEEFLKFNPKFRGMRITEEFMVQRIAEHYVQCPGR